MSEHTNPKPDPRQIDELTEAALMSLRHALQAVPFDDPYGYGVPLAILADPCVHDPLAAHGDTQPVPRMPLNISAIDRSLSPYLLILGGAIASERALHASVRLAVQECLGAHDTETGRPRSVCAWLVPAQPQEADWHHVGAALNRRAWVVPPTNEPRKVVRFWDPRITTQLPTTFGDDTWAKCLQVLGVQQWWTLAADATLTRVGEAAAPQGEAPDQPNWQLDTAQWHGLRMLAWRNVMAQAATRWQLLQPPEPRTFHDIAHRAFEHGLRDNADMLSFAYLALAVHPLFDRHPQALRALKDWQQNGRVAGGLADRIAMWGEDFLEHLQRGDWLHNAPPPAHNAPFNPTN